MKFQSHRSASFLSQTWSPASAHAVLAWECSAWLNKCLCESVGAVAPPGRGCSYRHRMPCSHFPESTHWDQRYSKNPMRRLKTGNSKVKKKKKTTGCYTWLSCCRLDTLCKSAHFILEPKDLETDSMPHFTD